MSSQRAPAANESRERPRQFTRHFRHVPFKTEVTVWTVCAHMDLFFMFTFHSAYSNPLII